MRTVKCESCGLTFPEGSETIHAHMHYELEQLARRAAILIKTDFPLRFTYVQEVKP